jgi:dipeptidyl aminopeptidase/acylaminoacyl peptidase
MKYANLQNAVWTDKYLVATYAIRYIKLTKDFIVEEDAKIGNSSLIEYYPFTMSLNRSKNKILYVVSKYNTESSGRLFEMDLSNYGLRKVIDSTENISSAVYLGGSDSVIVYYSLGNPIGTNAGYYKYNTYTQEKELLLSHYSNLGEDEIVNGFDISPDGKTMLVPIVKNYTPPMIARYDIESRKMIDTFYSFTNRNKDLLWMRYNNDGSKILYSNYGQRAFSVGPSWESDVGILRMKDKKVTEVIVKPTDTKWKDWTAPCPNWSPDCKHIVYGMTTVAETGAVGRYSLYIKTNVDEGISSVSGNAELPKVMKLE